MAWFTKLFQADEYGYPPVWLTTTIVLRSLVGFAAILVVYRLKGTTMRIFGVEINFGG